MRWQWSQARLTLRLTGTEPRRSGLTSSTVVESMVAMCDWGVDVDRGRVSQLRTVLAEGGSGRS